MKVHLTDAVVKRLPLPAKGNKIAYDDIVPGLGCRVTANGARAFILNYITRERGRERRYTIGSAEHWKATDAREEAKRLRREIDQGGDPLEDLEAARAAPTMAELIDRFLAEHAVRLRPSTRDAYKRMIDLHVRPHFGKHRKVADAGFEDIDALHRKITKSGATYMANRVVAVLSKMFSLAVRWRMRADNPVKGVEHNPESKRKRYVKPDELPKLIEALDAYPDQQIANVFRLLLLTGARRGEVLSIEWAAVDLTTGIWTKLGSTTKQKTDHVVPLSAPARLLLREIQDEYVRGHPGKPLPQYVFRSSNSDSDHLVDIQGAWRALTKAAGITGLRIHDLRHSFASQLASGGASLHLIGSLLGHSNPATTHRYAHLFDDPQRAAVEKVGAAIVNAGKPTEEPTPLRRGR
jgi:integrase